MGEVPLALAAVEPKDNETRRRGGKKIKFLAAAITLLGLLSAAAFAFPYLKAWYHLRAARLALAQYHTPEAIAHLQICLKIRPTDPEVLLLAARTARRAGNYVEAGVALDKYQNQRGCDEPCEVERILLCADSGDVDRAADFCKHWIEHGHPDTPFIYEAMAHGYLHAYRLPDARLLLQRWKQDQPDNPQSFFVEGEVLDCVGVSEEAAACYQRVLELDPEHTEARLKLTAALMERRDFAEIVPHLEYLLQRQPDNLQALVRLAACRSFLDQQAEAVRLLDDVLARKPDFAPALAERGKIALEREEYDAAENWLREAVEANPGDHATRFHLIRCLRRSGKEAEALKQEQQLRRLEADLRRINEIANIRMAEKPRDPALQTELGAIYLRCGFVDQGLHWLHTALRHDARYSAAHRALAEHYQRIGATEQAEQHHRLAARKQ